MDELKAQGPSDNVKALSFHHYLVTLRDGETGECRSYPIGAASMTDAIRGAKQENALEDAVSDGTKPHAWHALSASQMFMAVVTATATAIA